MYVYNENFTTFLFGSSIKEASSKLDSLYLKTSPKINNSREPVIFYIQKE